MGVGVVGLLLQRTCVTEYFYGGVSYLTSGRSNRERKERREEEFTLSLLSPFFFLALCSTFRRVEREAIMVRLVLPLYPPRADIHLHVCLKCMPALPMKATSLDRFDR